MVSLILLVSFFLYFAIVLFLFFLNRCGGMNTELKLTDAVFNQDLHVNVFAFYVKILMTYFCF